MIIDIKNTTEKPRPKDHMSSKKSQSLKPCTCHFPFTGDYSCKATYDFSHDTDDDIPSAKISLDCFNNQKQRYRGKRKGQQGYSFNSSSASGSEPRWLSASVHSGTQAGSFGINVPGPQNSIAMGLKGNQKLEDTDLTTVPTSLHGLEAPTTVDKLLGGSLWVKFGAGLAIISISPIIASFSTITIDLLPPGTSAEDILAMATIFQASLSLQSIRVHMRGESTMRAFVHFDDAEAADEAVKALHDTIFRGETIIVQAMRPINVSQDVTKIECSWSRPTVQSTQYFWQPRPMIADNQILAHLRRRFSVARYDDLELLSGHYDTRQHAIINLETAGEAMAIADKVKEELDLMFGTAISFEYSIKYSATFNIPANIYKVIKGEVRFLAQSESIKAGQYQSTHSLKGKGRATIESSIANNAPAHIKIMESGGQGAVVRITGQGGSAVKRAKRAIQRLLCGRIICDDEGKPLWNAALCSFEGQRLIQQACSLGVYIYCDARNQRVTLYGTPGACDAAEEMLKRQYRPLITMQYEISLSGRARRMGMRGGFRAVKELLGEDMVIFDPSEAKLIVKCTSEEIDQVRALLQKRSPGRLRHQQAGVQRQTARTSEDICPVCTDQADVSAVWVPCGHSYCRPCIQDYLQSALNLRKFPISCFYVSRDTKTQCATPFNLTLIQSLLSAVDAERLFQSSFSSFIQAHPNEYSYCPTPDCPTVYATTSLTSSQQHPASNANNQLMCSYCLISICTTCRAPAHNGVSCQQQQEATRNEEKFSEWKTQAGVKHCPRCGAAIEKNEGCNHMTCVCRAHVCWICMKEFPEGQIYAHMNNDCGGSGIPGARPPPRRPRTPEVPRPAAENIDIVGPAVEEDELQAQAALLEYYEERRVHGLFEDEERQWHWGADLEQERIFQQQQEDVWQAPRWYEQLGREFELGRQQEQEEHELQTQRELEVARERERALQQEQERERETQRLFEQRQTELEAARQRERTLQEQQEREREAQRLLEQRQTELEAARQREREIQQQQENERQARLENLREQARERQQRQEREREAERALEQRRREVEAAREREQENERQAQQILEQRQREEAAREQARELEQQQQRERQAHGQLQQERGRKRPQQGSKSRSMKGSESRSMKGFQCIIM